MSAPIDFRLPTPLLDRPWLQDPLQGLAADDTGRVGLLQPSLPSENTVSAEARESGDSILARLEQARAGEKMTAAEIESWPMEFWVEHSDPRVPVALVWALATQDMVTLILSRHACQAMVGLVQRALRDAARMGVRWTPLIDTLDITRFWSVAQGAAYVLYNAGQSLEWTWATLGMPRLSDWTRTLALWAREFDEGHLPAVLDALEQFEADAVWEQVAGNLGALTPEAIERVAAHPAGLRTLVRNPLVPADRRQQIVEDLVGIVAGRRAPWNPRFTSEAVWNCLLSAARAKALTPEMRARLATVRAATTDPTVRAKCAQAIVYAGGELLPDVLPLAGEDPALCLTLLLTAHLSPDQRVALLQPWLAQRLLIGEIITQALAVRGATALDAPMLQAILLSAHGKKAAIQVAVALHPRAHSGIWHALLRMPRVPKETGEAIAALEAARAEPELVHLLITHGSGAALRWIVREAPAKHVQEMFALMAKRDPEAAVALVDTWTFPADADWNEAACRRLLSAPQSRLREIAFTWMASAPQTGDDSSVDAPRTTTPDATTSNAALGESGRGGPTA